jgi:hypothetical protein
MIYHYESIAKVEIMVDDRNVGIKNKIASLTGRKWITFSRQTKKFCMKTLGETMSFGVKSGRALIVDFHRSTLKCRVCSDPLFDL